MEHKINSVVDLHNATEVSPDDNTAATPEQGGSTSQPASQASRRDADHVSRAASKRQRWLKSITKVTKREMSVARRSLGQLGTTATASRVVVSFRDVSVSMRIPGNPIDEIRYTCHSLARSLSCRARGTDKFGERERTGIAGEASLPKQTSAEQSHLPPHIGDKFKTVLSKVSGAVTSGQFLAILGASGSGKTTLLNCLAGRLPPSCTACGSIAYNGKTLQQQQLEALSAYVMQDDHLHPNLTVKETLLCVARLRQPLVPDHSQRVMAIIRELHLEQCADTLVGGGNSGIRGVSGGERRRVSIGIQLLQDSNVIFLDEPTSGLDAFTAKSIIALLARLAAAGRTVIATIHQPRSDIFPLFDLVMVLSGGKTMYFGPAKCMVAHFAWLGFACPRHMNPLDFVVDLCTIDYRSQATETHSVARLAVAEDGFNKSVLSAKLGELLEYIQAKFAPPASQPHQALEVDTPLTDARQAQATKANAASTAEVTQSAVAESVPEVTTAPSQGVASAENGASVTALSAENTNPPVQPSCWRQRKADQKRFVTLLGRNLLLLQRTWRQTLGVLIQFIVMGLTVGYIYANLGQDVIGATDRVALLYNCSSIVPFLVILSAIAKVSGDRPMYYRERRDGLYGPTLGYITKVLTEIPIYVLLTVTYGSIIYLVTELNPGFDRYATYILILCLTVFVSLGLAMAVAAFIVDFQQASFAANLIFTMNVLPCGFIINISTMRSWLRWMGSASYIRHAIEGMAANEFESEMFCPLIVGPGAPDYNITGINGTAPLPGACPVPEVQGIELVRALDMTGWSATENAALLAGIIGGLHIFALLGLRFVQQKPPR